MAEYMFSNICHFIPVSTHIRPKQLPLLVAQVGLEVHRLLVFSLGASWQSFWWFRSFHITGAGRWLHAALAGRVLQVFHETGNGVGGRCLIPGPFRLPSSGTQGHRSLPTSLRPSSTLLSNEAFSAGSPLALCSSANLRPSRTSSDHSPFSVRRLDMSPRSVIQSSFGQTGSPRPAPGVGDLRGCPGSSRWL